MKRILPFLLVVALCLPGAVFAKGKKAKKAKGTNVPEWAVESEKCSGDRDVKSVSLGKESIYVSEDLRSASFTKDSVHALRHNLVYYCASDGKFRRTPGMCSCGISLVPSFKHGESWYTLDKDLNGNITINGAPSTSPVVQEPVKKPVKKAKKAKKAKKSKKAKADKEAAPAAKEEPKKEEPAKGK